MKKALTFGLVAATSLAVAEDASVYDKIWGALAYDNEDAKGLQYIGLTGRLQGDAFSFADDDSNENEDVVWRRFRFGAKATVFQNFTLHSEMDLNLNNAEKNWDKFYIRLTDTYAQWQPSKAAKLKVGKQSAGFTLDGATSSKKLIVPERSIVAGNLWFGTEYFTGASLGGSVDRFSYKVGGFSSSGEAEFGHFESGYFGLLSGGMKVGEKGSLRLDYVYNDPNYDAVNKNPDYVVGTADHEHVLSLVYKTMLTEKLGLWADIAGSKGIKDDNAGVDQSDLAGIDIMPFYNFTDSLQLVLQYAGVTSLDKEADVKMARYASRNVGKTKVETAHNLLLGFNWYLYGHKLKWQNAIEYNRGESLAGTGEDYNGYGVTSALRVSW